MILVEGIDNLKRKLTKLLTLQVNTLSPAQKLRSEIQSNAPGTLGEHVHVDSNPDGHEVTVESDHAAFVEYGTSDTRAQPFVRPAIGTVGKSSIDDATRKFGKQITAIGEET